MHESTASPSLDPHTPPSVASRSTTVDLGGQNRSGPTGRQESYTERSTNTASLHSDRQLQKRQNPFSHDDPPQEYAKEPHIPHCDHHTKADDVSSDGSNASVLTVSAAPETVTGRPDAIPDACQLSPVATESSTEDHAANNSPSVAVCDGRMEDVAEAGTCTTQSDCHASDIPTKHIEEEQPSSLVEHVVELPPTPSRPSPVAITTTTTFTMQDTIHDNEEHGEIEVTTQTTATATATVTTSPSVTVPSAGDGCGSNQQQSVDHVCSVSTISASKGRSPHGPSSRNRDDSSGREYPVETYAETMHDTNKLCVNSDAPAQEGYRQSSTAAACLLPVAKSPSHSHAHPAPTSSAARPRRSQTNQAMAGTQSPSSIVLCLPIDLLHSIASFLTAKDWCSFGRTSSGSQRICREILRRVRVHGLRCAMEVITAWKLGQHADARELASMYIAAGVPIYPHSLGHSYHTILWRMAIEAREAQRQAGLSATEIDSNRNGGSSSGESADGRAVDAFFLERQEARDRDREMYENLTYLEEKSLFFLSRDDKAKQELHQMYARRRELQIGMASAQIQSGAMMDLLARIGSHQLIPPAIETTVGMGEIMATNEHQHVDEDPLHHILNDQDNADNNLGFNDSGRRSLGSPVAPLTRRVARSNSLSHHVSRSPKIRVKLHRHLLDQHLLGVRSASDHSGTMATPPITLSADFFNPSFPVQPGAIGYRGSSEGLYGMASPSSTISGLAWQTSTDTSIGLDPASMASTESQLRGLIGQEPLEGLDMDDADSEGGDLRQRIDDSSGRMRNVVGDGVPRLGLENELPPPRVLHSGGMEPTHQSTFPQDYILSHVDLDLYSASSVHLDNSESTRNDDVRRDIRNHLQRRCTAYKRRLRNLVSKSKTSSGEIDDCMLDLWDEFLPQTAGIHYHDRHTAVPRLANIQKFLSKPCPRAIGTVQCEIERIKINSKKKGVSIKGRLFPTYEYRLFIRHRPVDEGEETDGMRKDTVLMMARYRGRKDSATVASGSKKAANNFALCLPHEQDIRDHFRAVNEGLDIHIEERRACTNGADTTARYAASSVEAAAAVSSTSSPSFLGRLQSNFIGTEFQIFRPETRKPRASERNRCQSPIAEPHLPLSEDEDGYGSGAMSDTAPTTSPSSGRRRRINFRRYHTHYHGRGRRQEDAVPGRGAIHESARTAEPPRSSLRRSRSSGSMRPARVNRRAIANTPVTTAEKRTEHAELVEVEDGAITYTANLLGSRPRIMDVCIPRVSPDGVAGVEWRTYLEQATDIDPTVPASARMLNRFKLLQQKLSNVDDPNSVIDAGHGFNSTSGSDNSPESDVLDDVSHSHNGSAGYVAPNDFGLLALQNRPPWWNAELQSFVLNFAGRVSLASVKNFQLCDRNDQEHVMLQFGRIQGRHSFTMDFQYPLTAIQAFAIAISSLQSKISFA